MSLVICHWSFVISESSPVGGSPETTGTGEPERECVWALEIGSFVIALESRVGNAYHYQTVENAHPTNFPVANP
ncbi:hypothetical protein [Scytonema sp. NUACC26]|uniref:hypothetical protein n=1 Tax=Scytonema sp. NUACC26 TaxID=3140176 RepID=UPI0038B40260